MKKADVFRLKYWEFDISTFVHDPSNTIIKQFTKEISISGHVAPKLGCFAQQKF